MEGTANTLQSQPIELISAEEQLGSYAVCGQLACGEHVVEGSKAHSKVMCGFGLREMMFLGEVLFHALTIREGSCTPEQSYFPLAIQRQKITRSFLEASACAEEQATIPAKTVLCSEPAS